MKVINADRIYSYIKSEINPYGKPFEGTVYEFGMKVMEYIENASKEIEYTEEFECEELCDVDDWYDAGFSKGWNDCVHKVVGEDYE